MTDWKNNDLSWNGNWQYGASINETDWTAEFSIPLSDLGLVESGPWKELSLSVSRSYPGGESSRWSGICTLANGNSIKCLSGGGRFRFPAKI
jgi:hypothetical protein